MTKLQQYLSDCREVVEAHAVQQPVGAQPIDPESDLYCKLVLLPCEDCGTPTFHADHRGFMVCDACYDAQDADETAENVRLDNRQRARDMNHG